MNYGNRRQKWRSDSILKNKESISILHTRRLNIKRKSTGRKSIWRYSFPRTPKNIGLPLTQRQSDIFGWPFECPNGRNRKSKCNGNLRLQGFSKSFKNIK